jgi:dTMP kinase
MMNRHSSTALPISTARDAGQAGGCGPGAAASGAGIDDLFFKASLDVSLSRILDNRPTLKHHEAGMDLNLSPDPYESFRIFQGRIFEQYLAMSTEFRFVVMDANQRIEEQQGIVRRLVSAHVDLEAYRAAKVA